MRNRLFALLLLVVVLAFAPAAICDDMGITGGGRNNTDPPEPNDPPVLMCGPFLAIPGQLNAQVARGNMMLCWEEMLKGLFPPEQFSVTGQDCTILGPYGGGSSETHAVQGDPFEGLGGAGGEGGGDQ